MIKEVFYYVFRTPWQQKKDDWNEYQSMCADVENAHARLEKCRDNLGKVTCDLSDNRLHGCRSVKMWFDVMKRDYIISEMECKSFWDKSGVCCNDKCPFFGAKNNYLQAVEDYKLWRRLKYTFWPCRVLDVASQKAK